jgi:hypothetical protein
MRIREELFRNFDQKVPFLYYICLKFSSLKIQIGSCILLYHSLSLLNLPNTAFRFTLAQTITAIAMVYSIPASLKLSNFISSMVVINHTILKNIHFIVSFNSENTVRSKKKNRVDCDEKF